MRQIFICVLSLSLSGALTGLGILFIRPVTGRFFSGKWNYYIWLLVIARLMVPICFESSYSYVLQKSEASGPEEIQAETGQNSIQDKNISQTQKQAQENNINMPEQAQNSSFSPPQNPRAGADWESLTAILWLAGAGVSLFIKIKNYMHFTSRLKRDCAPVLDDRVNNMAKELQHRLCMRKSPALYVSGRISVPITVGLLHPAILLPKDNWDLKELQMVLHHELIHVKRKDLWYKWLYQLLLCIHWFNPVLYLIGIKLNIDCELSCDEAVIAVLTKDGQRAYGNVLIDTARKNMMPGRNIPSTTLLERKEDLKMRLKGILHYKRPNGFRAAASVCFTGILLLLSACASVQTEPDAMPVRLSTDAGEEYSSFWDDTSAGYVSFWDAMGTALESWIDTGANTGLDEFLGRPVLADKQSEAWKAYDDDSLIAGKDINDQWHMHTYMGGGQRIKCDGMYLNGITSVRIFYANRDMELQVDSSFEVKEGRFKIIHINPDGEVAVINETGDAGSFTVNMKEGRNVIKFAGQGAKVKNLLVEYPYLKEKNFENIYYSEQDEEKESVTAEIKAGKVDKAKLMELLYYLDDEVVSEAFALLLEQGVPLTDDEFTDLFIYSDSDLSALYLGEAIKNGRIDHLGEEIIIDLAPYLGGERLRELLLATDGKISGDTVSQCAPYLGSGRLKEVLLSMDDISFGLISDCASYLGSSGLEEVLKKYLEDGNELTFSQFADVSPYLGGNATKRLDELNRIQ